MAAGIICGLCTYVSQNAYDGKGVTVWDGEVARYDARGQTVGPESSGGLSDWPVVKFSLPESATGGFTREYTTEDSYHDDGVVILQIWHNTREQAEATLDMIEALLAKEENWIAISALIPSPYRENPHYITQLLLKYWTSRQVEGFRTQKSELVYTCEAYFKCGIHGALPSVTTDPSAASFNPSLLDDYNRADTGPPPSGSYVTPTGGYNGMQVVSNRLAPSASIDSAAIWSTLYNADQEVAIRIPVLFDVAELLRLVVRNQSATALGACYYVEFERGSSVSKVRFYYYNGTVANQIGAEIERSALLVANDQCGVRAVGSTLTAYVNGTAVGQRTDATLNAAGRFMVNIPAGSTSRLDDLRGGNV